MMIQKNRSKVASRTKNRRRILVMYAVCWTIGLGLFTHLWGNIASADSKYTTYTVSNGDTLWTIASHLNPNQDPRVIIHEIEDLNHMTSTDLAPGQALLLPDMN